MEEITLSGLTTSKSQPDRYLGFHFALPAHEVRVERGPRRVYVDGQRTEQLSLNQWKLLTALVDADGDVLSRNKLIFAVYGKTQGYSKTDQSLAALIRRVRQKLGGACWRIQSIRDHGYRWEAGDNER